MRFMTEVPLRVTTTLEVNKEHSTLIQTQAEHSSYFIWYFNIDAVHCAFDPEDNVR